MKIGGYLCTGCGIGDRLDTKSLESVAVREGRIGFCKTHDFLCSQAGVDMIKADMALEGDDKVTKAPPKWRGVSIPLSPLESSPPKTTRHKGVAAPLLDVSPRGGDLWRQCRLIGWPTM